MSASVEATVSMATAALALVTAGVAALSTLLFCKYRWIATKLSYKVPADRALSSNRLVTSNGTI